MFSLVQDTNMKCPSQFLYETVTFPEMNQVFLIDFFMFSCCEASASEDDSAYGFSVDKYSFVLVQLEQC